MAQPAAAKYHPKLAKWQAFMEKRTNLADVIVQPSFEVDCINTGSTVLNILIGGSRLPNGKFVCPGYPKGKIIEIYGRESSGKSTLAMTAMGQAIQSGPDGTGLYVDLEHAVVDAYAMKLGCDFRPPSMGGGGRAIRVAPHTFEEAQALVDGAALAGVTMIVIDSVAGFVSRREAQRDVTNEKEKQGVAEIPRLMSAWMPKLQAIIAKTGTVVVFLNQTRDKIGAMGYTEEALKSTTGGNALKFWASLRWMLKPKMAAKAKIWNPLLKEFEEVPIATDIEVKNIKNKIDARQGHSGLITIRYGVGIDEMRTMMNVAVAYDIVKKTKNAKKQEVFTYKSPTSGEVIEAIGIEKFRTALHFPKNKGAFDEMMGACSERIMQGFRAIDDEALAQLAEDAVTTRIEQPGDDDYDDSSDPANNVDPSEMGIDAAEIDALGGASVNADDI